MFTIATHSFVASTLARVAPALLVIATLVGVTSNAHAAEKKAPAAAVSADDGDKAAQPTGVVNINTANEEELQLLPGVGPSKALAIIAWRKKYGSFRKVEDLARVKGFGHKSLKKLKPFLALSGATTLKEKPGAKPKRDDEAPPYAAQN